MRFAVSVDVTVPAEEDPMVALGVLNVGWFATLNPSSRSSRKRVSVEVEVLFQRHVEIHQFAAVQDVAPGIAIAP